eukprot:8610953-Ditylum_brightwellii.AAC.1
MFSKRKKTDGTTISEMSEITDSVDDLQPTKKGIGSVFRKSKGSDSKEVKSFQTKTKEEKRSESTGKKHGLTKPSILGKVKPKGSTKEKESKAPENHKGSTKEKESKAPENHPTKEPSNTGESRRTTHASESKGCKETSVVPSSLQKKSRNVIISK